ncbi:MAG: sulfatase-like hydrolase/transferase [Verrucomicrobiaceae bacterium]|nr:sulfatase-like hydrolase/transferase [Verrucomicrobiaceae bacterium]
MKPLLSLLLLALCASLTAADKPNILWLTSEDHSPTMGCYGDKVARTPNIDALAAKGMLFKKAWSVAPVCAPARTTIISGIYPSSSGGLHMRSMVSMPNGTKMYPEFLRDAGYYCTNNSKTDYNLREPAKLWDASSGNASWKNRPKDQPFFAIFNSTKSHESQIRTRPHTQITKPEDIRVPAYHPDTPEVRQDWAQYYDKVSEADADAGKRLKEVEEAGLADDTIVFYYADHGSGMPRSKRWPSNSGLHVPFVVYFPEKYKHLAPKEYTAGGQSDRLISFVDLAPTLLSLVGIQPPDWMQGHAFAGPFQTEPQPFIFGLRGRMDERMDLVRSVTDGRYVYLRNYYPHVSQAQRVAYQFETPATRVWNDLFLAGKTTPAQSLFWRTPKDPEELYDLQSDPDEVINLAASPEHKPILEKLRAAQREHLAKIRDIGFLPEHEMHTRSEGSTPYDTAHDSAKYPFEKILAAADLASGMDSTATPELARLMTDDADSAVRFWGALGLLMRGESATRDQTAALLKALEDPSIDVRIPAAQALGQFGDAAALAKALPTLSALAAPKDHDVLTAMAALAAIEALGPKADSLKPQITTLDPTGPAPDDRYNSYVPRLIENIVPKPKSAKPKGKGKNKNKAKGGSK